MSELKAKLQKSIVSAMKEKEATRLETLRYLMSAIRKKEIDTRKDLSEGEAEKVLLTHLKQLQETLNEAKKTNLSDRVQASENEIKIVREFLPPAMGEAELNTLISNLVVKLRGENKIPQGNAGMGSVMKEAMVLVGSRAEGQQIQAAVKKALGI